MATQARPNQTSVVIQQGAATSGIEAPNQNNQQPGKCMGITIVVFGGIDIIIGVSYLIYQVARLSKTTGVFSGVWGGLFVIATGCIAIAAGRTRLKGPIIALLAMSIVSILLAGIIIPSLLGADAALAQLQIGTYSYTYAQEAAVLLPILGILGFGCFLTTSILSCVALCSTDCCNQNPTPRAAGTQMVVLSPDGKMVPVQVINASGTQQVVPLGSDYTALQWRHGQRDTPARPSAPELPPPPYTPNPEPPPNYAHGATARESTTSGIYTEIMNPPESDTGIYLHPPPLQDEDGYEEPITKTPTRSSQDAGYLEMTPGRQASGREEAIHPRQEHPPPPPTIDDGSYADVQH